MKQPPARPSVDTMESNPERRPFDGKRVPFLVLLDEGRWSPVSPGAVIGRGHDAAIRLNSEEVSRHHARLFELKSGVWSLFDLNSRNGTTVQGEAVDEVRELEHGDEICLGGAARMRFVFEEEGYVRALEAQRLEALGQIAGGIAHEFNNLLSVILANVDLALWQLEQTGSLEGITAGLEDSRSMARRGAELTRGLLTFARRNDEVPCPPQATEIGPVIEQFARMARPAFDKTFLLHTDVRGVLLVRVDPNQLQQVLLNLAFNARDAMEGGGIIQVRAREIQSEGKQPWVEISVSDSGVGMDSATRERLFEPFFTTKDVGQGTGLGMSVVYGIVLRHGGDIAVESQQGRGTVVRVLLPLAEVTEPDCESDSQTITNAPAGTVLVVDDEPALRRIVRRVLVSRGYDCMDANGGQAALEALRAQPQIVLVILDLQMPGWDGQTTLCRLRAHAPELKVLISTGNLSNASRERLLELGVSGFIPKPYDATELLASVTGALSG